ncbi:MAG: hypothetical protein D6725_17335 [Planctomycetota bacterium]|nr:MAG: hypothetical protein D6725_17335 [Planctomycetota bacterium]
MDLPTCPSCKQSVLDEDVENCPFCGAPMRGKGKPAPARAPVEKKPERPPTDAKTEEDPFEVDRAVLKRAIRLSRKPAKGRMLRVVCPMCETPGFAPDNAAGKEVRCANPDCLVPVFTAPAPRKSDRPSEQEKPRSTTPVVVGTVLGLIVVAGVGYYLLRPESEPQPPVVSPGARVAGKPDGRTEVTDGAGTGQEGGTGKKTGGEQTRATRNDVPSEEEILRRALARLERTVLDRDRNRSPDYCRRLLAEALVEMGQFETARQHIAQFARLRPPQSSYAVLPIVRLGWLQLAGNRRAEAAKAVDQAMQVAESLPRYGRFPIHAAMQLAALLIALDRTQEAEQWLLGHQHSGPIALHAVFVEAAESLRLYDVDRLAANAPVFTWDAPQTVGVAIVLGANGLVDPATRWLVRLRNAESRAEAFAELATSLLYRGEPGSALQKVVDQAKGRSAGEAAFVAARLATTFGGTDPEKAAEFARQAAAVLEQADVPPAFRLPDLVGIYRWKENDVGPQFVMAKASAELARFHARQGDAAAAWTWVQRGLAYLRAVAPSTVATDQRDRELAQGGIDAVAAQLRSALELESESEARRAAIDYRANLRNLQRRAVLRQRLTAILLREAAEWGLLSNVLDELQRVAGAEDVDVREELLPVEFLGYRLSVLAQTEQQKQIVRKLAGGTRFRPDVVWAAERKTAPLCDSGAIDDLVATLQRLAPDPTISEDDFREWKEVWMLRLACRLAARRSAEDALRYVRGFSRQLVWQEDAYRTVAAYASLHGAAAEVWRFIEEQDTVPPTGVAALCRGVIGGLTARR